jgi:hypothetical protein
MMMPAGRLSAGAAQESLIVSMMIVSMMISPLPHSQPTCIVHLRCVAPPTATLLIPSHCRVCWARIWCFDVTVCCCISRCAAPGCGCLSSPSATPQTSGTPLPRRGQPALTTLPHGHSGAGSQSMVRQPAKSDLAPHTAWSRLHHNGLHFVRLHHAV